MYPFAPCKGIWIPILGDPGAESGDEGKSKRAEKCGTKKSKERREELLGTMSYQTSSKRSPSFWLLIGARKLVFFRSWGGDLAGLSWPWGRALDRSCSTGRGNFESFFALRGTDVGIFDCWLGRKRLRSNSHASRMQRTVWKDMEIVEANENNPKWVVLINWTFQDTVVSK